MTVLSESAVRKRDCSVSPQTARETSDITMLLLLNKDTGKEGGSGDVECEGMSIDDDSEGIGIDVDIDDSKEGMVIGDERKDGTGTGDVECGSMYAQVSMTTQYSMKWW